MASPAEIVEGYFDAWTSKDFETARSLLHDDLSFRGPIETLDNADALIESIKGLAQIVTGAERRALLEQGDNEAPQQIVVVDYENPRHAITCPVCRGSTSRFGGLWCTTPRLRMLGVQPMTGLNSFVTQHCTRRYSAEFQAGCVDFVSC